MTIKCNSKVLQKSVKSDPGLCVKVFKFSVGMVSANRVYVEEAIKFMNYMNQVLESNKSKEHDNVTRAQIEFQLRTESRKFRKAEKDLLENNFDLVDYEVLSELVTDYTDIEDFDYNEAFYKLQKVSNRRIVAKDSVKPIIQDLESGHLGIFQSSGDFIDNQDFIPLSSSTAVPTTVQVSASVASPSVVAETSQAQANTSSLIPIVPKPSSTQVRRAKVTKTRTKEREDMIDAAVRSKTIVETLLGAEQIQPLTAANVHLLNNNRRGSSTSLSNLSPSVSPLQASPLPTDIALSSDNLGEAKHKTSTKAKATTKSYNKPSKASPKATPKLTAKAAAKSTSKALAKSSTKASTKASTKTPAKASIKASTKASTKASIKASTKSMDKSVSNSTTKGSIKASIKPSTNDTTISSLMKNAVTLDHKPIAQTTVNTEDSARLVTMSSSSAPLLTHPQQILPVSQYQQVSYPESVQQSVAQPLHQQLTPQMHNQMKHLIYSQTPQHQLQHEVLNRPVHSHSTAGSEGMIDIERESTPNSILSTVHNAGIYHGGAQDYGSSHSQYNLPSLFTDNDNAMSTYRRSVQDTSAPPVPQANNFMSHFSSQQPALPQNYYRANEQPRMQPLMYSNSETNNFYPPSQHIGLPISSRPPTSLPTYFENTLPVNSHSTVFPTRMKPPRISPKKTFTNNITNPQSIQPLQNGGKVPKTLRKLGDIIKKYNLDEDM